MGVPQILWIGLTSMTLGFFVLKHGERQEGNYSFPCNLVSILLIGFLFYCGNFFHKWAAPQIILVVWWSVFLGATLAKHGQPKLGKVNIFIASLLTIVEAGLLYWGGFFSPVG